MYLESANMAAEISLRLITFSSSGRGNKTPAVILSGKVFLSQSVSIPDLDRGPFLDPLFSRLVRSKIAEVVVLHGETGGHVSVVAPHLNLR